MSSDTDERREQVLEALVTAGADGVSGQLIAEQLGCSRAAIHRHVETLRRHGVAIEGVHEGYRLAATADPIVPRLVQVQLSAPIAGPVRWSPTTASTNDDAVAQARAGALEGLVIGTDFQTRGRGRRGREWRSEPGDAVLCSVLLRPPVSPADVGVLPIIAAVSVAEALGDDAGIIWPNDIVIDDRKVCGILCELSADESGVAWVVVGMGINVRGVPELADARWQPGALADTDITADTHAGAGRRAVDTGPPLRHVAHRRSLRSARRIRPTRSAARIGHHDPDRGSRDLGHGERP